MTPQIVFYIIVACFLISTLTVCLVIEVFIWRHDRRAERAPVADKLLRPPGESLRLKMEPMRERLGLLLVLAMIVPGLALAAHLVSSPDGKINPTLASVGLVVPRFAGVFHTTGDHSFPNTPQSQSWLSW